MRHLGRRLAHSINRCTVHPYRVRIRPSPFSVLDMQGIAGDFGFLCTPLWTPAKGLTRLPLRPWENAAILGLLMHVNDELAGWRTIIVLPIVFLLPGSAGDHTV